MPKQEILNLHPTGWENDPDEERIKLSAIDTIPNCAYNHYVVFFRLDDKDKCQAAHILRLGLERTLSQARYLCGTIEKDAEEGGLSFVKKRDTTVRLVIQHLDCPGDEETYPSLDDLERAHFSCRSLGNLKRWGIPEMVWGDDNPAADVDNSPTTAAYQLNLVRGGLVLSMHSHHYASDVMGWSNFTRQLADNCCAIANQTEFPPWDPACIDASRFTKHIPPASLVDGPPTPQRHPGHPRAQQACLFHLPASKAARLRQLVTPPSSSSSSQTEAWTSTYDAMCAYLWRQLTKVRAPLYSNTLAGLATAPGIFGEAVNMRPRLSEPLPARMMRSVVWGAYSDKAPVTPRPTHADVVSEATLAALARYVRRLTNSCTEAHMKVLVDVIAPIRDKRSISLRADALPPMTILVSDHRSADVGGFDFGFGTPITYRHMWGDDVSPGLVLIYPPIRSSKDPDEGCTFTITLETEIVPKLLAEPEWNEYFEYRGTD